jgi:nitric oxide reductase NorD protein
MDEPKLTANDIAQRLAQPLAAVLSPRRTLAMAAEQLAALDARCQEMVIQRVIALANTNAELGYQYAHHAAPALALMPADDVQAWAEQAVEIYDKAGLFAATNWLEKPQRYAEEITNQMHAVSFDEVAGMLSIFVNGLGGRWLKLETGDPPYTDSETLFLPRRVNRFDDAQLNRSLYKAMATYLWAQTWYGTFRLDENGRSLEERLNAFDNPRVARDQFDALEAIRINACIAHDLPGLYREWQRLQAMTSSTEYPGHWHKYIARLQQDDASAQTSLAVLPGVLNDLLPAPLCYQGKLMPAQVAQTMALRMEQEKSRLQSALNSLAIETRAPAMAQPAPQQPDTETLQFEIRTTEKPGAPGEVDLQLSLGGQALGIPPELEALLRSILQDIGGFPVDYLVPAGDNDFDPKAVTAEMDAESEEALGQAIWYPEWDHQRHQYRKDWCALREQDIEPDEGPFVGETIKKYHGELQHLRKAFEALRGEDRMMKRQPDGDDIDFDAVVQAMTDLSLGMEMPQQLFSRTHRHERNIAVMFMVDMSGSTKGWVNDAEREALVLLCQALEILGDRYAIYGFSSMTRKRCDLYRIKSFDEPYSRLVDQRITGVTAKDYTRMGVTIRHLSKLLHDVDARTKLLITLSDGKPDDFDGYRGDYGIEDTRKALIEAKQKGIHSFCITIDDEARDYLPHMYGAVNYTIIDDVRKLPLKVAEVYRRLTV